MGLPFFADHCVSNAIMQTLRDAGHDVLRLRDHLPIESPDPIVMLSWPKPKNWMLSCYR
jgi:hypothetical protein